VVQPGGAPTSVCVLSELFSCYLFSRDMDLGKVFGYSGSLRTQDTPVCSKTLISFLVLFLTF
jgi:hypothetical protein